MGFLKKLFGSEKNDNKELPKPLLDEKTLSMTGIEFACYLS